MPWRCWPRSKAACARVRECAAARVCRCASARLRGHGDAACAARAEQRETNELRSVARAEVLARAALGDTGFEALRREGAQWSHEQAGALAFAPSDGG